MTRADATMELPGFEVLKAAYRARVETGELHEDAVQLEALRRLGRVLDDEQRAQGRGTLWSGWFQARASHTRRGLYLWGGVGRGKTMLMDLFYAHVDRNRRQRWHFHAFMDEVHAEIARQRNANPGDPIPLVARKFAAAGGVLCFDELHVTDITDATILGRLFRALFDLDVVVVATSNAPPEGLYKNGLNRDLFVPAIELMREHLQVCEFADGPDYRMGLMIGERLYFSPLGYEADQAMDGLWSVLTKDDAVRPAVVTSLGRSIQFPSSAGGHVRTTFGHLCGSALGARDYLAIARRFHTVCLDRVPQLGPHNRNEARRFINLVDTLYDNHVWLAMSADAEPEALYISGDGADHFERTVSRLMEMRSQGYLATRKDRLETLAKPVSPTSE